MSLRDVTVEANGLAHHVVVHPGDGDAVLVIHGYLDLARSFEPLLAALGAAGHRVVAPDLRGHGDSARAPAGSYYHFADYLFDVVSLLDAMGVERAHVVAHSMGGTVATMLAGTFPERVRSLALLEGVGPPAMAADLAPLRTRRWFETVARVRARPERRMASLDEAAQRMKVSHPALPLELLREKAAAAAREVEGGGWVFRFDPLHQSTSPGRFDAEGFEAYVDAVRCPVLHVWGHDPEQYPDLSARTRRYAGARMVVLPDAGHMMHWTAPEALAREVLGFLASTA